MYALGQAIEWPLTLNDIEDGVTNADSTPTGAVYRNGAIDGAVTVTVTNIGTGHYKTVFSIPGGWAAGDDFYCVATCVVDGITFAVTTGVGRIYAAATDADGAAIATATKLLKYVQLLARSDAAITADNATELTAINASGGSGAGDYAATSDSLEALADGSASTSLTILPLATTIVSEAITSYALTCGQYAGKSWTLAVFDSEGDPVSLSGKTIKIAVWRPSAPTTIVVSLTGTVGGSDNNQVTFAITGTNTAAVEVYKYTMRNTTNDTDLIDGTITINPAPDIT